MTAIAVIEMDAMYCPSCLNIVVKKKDANNEIGWFCERCKKYLTIEPISSDKAMELHETMKEEREQQSRKARGIAEQKQRQFVAYQMAKRSSRLSYAPILVALGAFLFISAFIVLSLMPYLIPQPPPPPPTPCNEKCLQEYSKTVQDYAKTIEMCTNIQKILIIIELCGFIIFAIGTYFGVKEAVS